MIDLDELKRLAEAAGGIEWYASHACLVVKGKDTRSRAIYHRPTENHCVEIVESADPKNGESIHSDEWWQFIGAASPAVILELITHLQHYMLAADAEARYANELKAKTDALKGMQ